MLELEYLVNVKGLEVHGGVGAIRKTSSVVYTAIEMIMIVAIYQG